MHSELHTNSDIYNKPFPKFGRPKVIGYSGLENLKFAKQLREQRVRFDLNVLYEEAKHKPDDLDVKLTELLKFLLQHQKRLNFPVAKTLESVNFHCYRGLMTLVACTPYENKEPWKIVAILLKGNIYLCARDTEDKRNRKLNMDEMERRCSSWGFKFEQYILSDSPSTDPNPNEPVDETEEFSLVFQTTLNRHSIVYGAEMDGIRCDKEPVPQPPTEEHGQNAVVEYLSTKEFIELKTCKHIEFPRQQNNFRRWKTRKWWCQSFLVGIENILCGFRDDNGIVEDLKIFPVKELAKMSQRFWNPNVCMNFLDDFLTFVKRSLAREVNHIYGPKGLENLETLPMVSLLFEWRPGMPVLVSNSYVHDDDPILHSWFVDAYTHQDLSK